METLFAVVFATELLLCAIVFVGRMERRERFRLKVALCVGTFYVMVALSGYLLPNLELLRIIWRVAGMPILLIFIYNCWKLSLSLSFYYAMWAFMLWQLLCEFWLGVFFALRLEMSLYIHGLLGGVLVFIIGNLVLGYTIVRWMQEDSKDKLGPRQVISATVIFVAFEVAGYAPEMTSMATQDGEWMIIYLTQLLLVVILYLQNELFKKSAMRQELAVMNMLWKKEQEQYELSKENIALINQKCHDLKHQIHAIRYLNKEEIDAYLEEMEDSIRIYESIVKTGNEVLDTILTEKSLYCKERGIIVSCVADGSQMGFINTIDLYAILGNALDNAIEAVEKFQHQEKRQIDVMIYRQQQFLVINIVNPAKEKLVYDEELPRTTKPDRFHHGFGLRSIQYMVKKYDGHLNISEEDGCFSLKLLIPIPQKAST